MRISIRNYEYDSILFIFLNTHYWSIDNLYKKLISPCCLCQCVDILYLLVCRWASISCGNSIEFFMVHVCASALYLPSMFPCPGTRIRMTAVLIAIISVRKLQHWFGSASNERLLRKDNTSGLVCKPGAFRENMNSVSRKAQTIMAEGSIQYLHYAMWK